MYTEISILIYIYTLLLRPGLCSLKVVADPSLPPEPAGKVAHVLMILLLLLIIIIMMMMILLLIIIIIIVWCKRTCVNIYIYIYTYIYIYIYVYVYLTVMCCAVLCCVVSCCVVLTYAGSVRVVWYRLVLVCKVVQLLRFDFAGRVFTDGV